MNRKIDTAVRLLKSDKGQIPYAIFRNVTKLGLTKWIPDEKYLKIMFRLSMGYELNLQNPKTFNEKLQWLKLHDRRFEYVTMVDKYRVRKYISETIGDQYLIPLLGMWEDARDIDFNKLPNQFVLKCNHDSGSVIICKDKQKFDKSNAVKKLNHALKTGVRGYWFGREWPYKNVKPCIIAEKYMTDSDKGGIKDYKVHNFNGVPKVILVCSDRFSELKETFYTPSWEKIDLNRPEHRSSTQNDPRPGKLDDMLRISAALSKTYPFMRTDFYEVNDNLYFGEITLYPASGFEKFTPETADSTLGSWLKLPETRGGGYTIKINNTCIWIHEEKKDNSYQELRDYKFFCFDGQVKCFKIDFDRFTNHHANYFSPEGELLKFGEVVCKPDFSKKLIIPTNIQDMIKLAEKISKNLPFVRVDLYDSCGQIYFGEMTFYPASGFGPFVPEEWDNILGSWIDLTKI